MNEEHLINKAKSLKRLEQELNKLTYEGIPIGGLLAFQYGKIYKSEKTLSWRSILALVKNVLQNLTLGYTRNNLLQNKVVITKHGSTNHLNRMMDPLIEHWQEDTIIFQLKETPVQDGVNAIRFYQAVRISRRGQLKVLRWWVINRGSLSNVIESNEFAGNYKYSLLFDLVMQLVKIQFWLESFSNGYPKLVITDYDRGIHVSPLILVSKKFYIPTYVIQHGVINPPYSPASLLADNVCVWGDIQKQQYLDAGERAEKIHVTGTPIIDHEFFDQKECIAVKKKYKFSADQKQIALGINPIKLSELKKLISDFLKSVENIGGIEPIIKLHPAQSIAYIKSICSIPKNVRLIDKQVSNMEFFKIIDGLVIYNSGLGIEAVQFDVPVAVYNNLSSSLGNGQVMIDNSLAMEINSIAGIEYWINEIKNGRINTAQMANSKNEFYHLMGSDAIRSIIEVIEIN